ncbi:piggyBac transposable element-derived protein 4-like [Alosa sapidissima]|uniref:piggyBac transposable element-derived protein 4-like n=1 Tax=Alosa sapidissima TaxID=34773 RepID=UPI001C091D8B|nr:piggyBac transposable element-derived protein 4-like [Alosa sapidissima]
MEESFNFNWDSDSDEEFFGFGEEDLEGVLCGPGEDEEGVEEGGAAGNFTEAGDFTGCGEGDAPREWLDVTGKTVATEGERKRSDGRIPFVHTNPRPGPQRVWDCSDPYLFFKAFFSDCVIDLMVAETNRYAEALASTELASHSRLRDYKPTDRSEMEAFLAIQISMGLTRKPQIADYWSTQSSLGLTPNFARVMTRNRFQLLSSCIHFNDNSLRLERGQPGYDPLFKIRPLMDLVLKSFQSEYYPHEHLSIDESMVSFRGRVFFRQYVPNKRHRFGLKNFVLSDATSNYTYLWHVYTGGAFNYDRCLGIGHSSVVGLLREAKLLGKGHSLYTDSYYTSPALFQELHRQNTGACGTVRVNRKGMPPQLHGLKLRPSDPPVFFEKRPLLTASFRDAGTVTVLSTVHDNLVITKRVRSKGPDGYRTLRKPKSVEDYNRFMGGVDRGDQLCSYYSYQHRAMKWYHRLFHHIREVALVNAYILHKESGNTMQSAGFRELVVKGLLRRRQIELTPPPRPISTPLVPVRLTGRHFLGQHEKSRPDCKVCSTRKRSPDDAHRGRKQTPFFCKTCSDHPALCPTDCFEMYHTKLVYKH